MGRERTLPCRDSVHTPAPRPHWWGAVAALAMLPAIAPFAWAQSECQVAFEKWTKLSDARLRKEVGGGRGACVPSEAVRAELLAALTRTRGLCDATQSTLLNINQTFIISLAVCEADTADSPPAVTPAPPESPKVAAPLPVAPPPPPPAPPKPAVVAPPPSPPCLEIAPGKDEQFALVNRRCRGHTVLAVIETRGAAGETVCKGYSISQSLAVRTSGTAPPRINLECVLSQGPCNRDRLESMFPECDW
jgi:hypothetical protein